MNFIRIFIGCSAKENLDSRYQNLAHQLSASLSNYEVVVGGSFVGLMKLVCEQIPKNQVTQVYLKDYFDEIEDNSNSVFLCDTSFERVKQIWDLSDCFLILPGGTGTLSELFSFLEENRTKKKKKSIYLLNWNGFYNELIVFLQKLQQERFREDDILEEICMVKSVEEFIELLEKEV